MKFLFRKYVLIGIKGILMGAVDAVPGISGGTIALIVGVYEELISTISNINIKLLKKMKNESFKAFWIKANGNFILSISVGIATGFILFLNLVKHAMEIYPILTWSFLFGLVVASGVVVFKRVSNWNLVKFIFFLLGVISIFYLTSLPASTANSNYLYLSIVSSIAICAMLLPGISGSFILIIFGAYGTLRDSINNFDVLRLTMFALGAIAGLLGFSKILKWLLKNHRGITFAMLSGLIFGSLNKLWPWKRTIKLISNKDSSINEFSDISGLATLSVFQKQTGDFDTYKPFLEHNISPFAYSLGNNGISSNLSLAIPVALIGFILVIISNKYTLKQN